MIARRARGQFESANACARIDREYAVLGAQGGASDEVVAPPDETCNAVPAPKPGRGHLGVAAMVRDLDRTQWQVEAPIVATGSERPVLAVDCEKAELETA